MRGGTAPEMEIHVSNQPRTPGAGVDLKACLHAVSAPLLTWVVPVLAATLSGHPGVACLTPMAWLLAYWCGMRYVALTGAQHSSSSLGPAAAGALLGLGIGGVFALGMGALETKPDEIAKAWTMTAVIVGAGVVACPVLATIGAWTVRRRLAAGR
jgi:hypothetical protein